MSENTIFAPTLGKEYCAYFIYISIFAFVFLILTIVDAGYAIIKGEITVVSGILALMAPFIMYLQSRILYSMCYNSLV